MVHLSMFLKVLRLLFIAVLLPCAPLSAESITLPKPGTMVPLSASFTPAYLKGMVIDPKDPFKFDFIINPGEEKLTREQKQETYTKLIKYFLAALAIPDDKQWVNLSPYEKDRIIPESFGQTQMGNDLLAQDYILKQLSASLLYPKGELGKKFWTHVYANANEKNINIPINTFNKIWIVPDTAVVYEKGNTVYVLENHLKVMMEQDYLATEKNKAQKYDTTKDTFKRIILPHIEKEVNEGQNFALLRQVYSGMLLASWYKRTLKDTIIGKLYTNQEQVQGVDSDPNKNKSIYEQYIKSFKKGVFNFIKEDDGLDGHVAPKKYFSGGTKGYEGIAILKDATHVHQKLPTQTNEELVSARLERVNVPQSLMRQDKAMHMSEIKKSSYAHFFSSGKAALMREDVYRYYTEIKRIVNPNNLNLKVFYGGAGADLSNVIAATDASTYFMVARYNDKNNVIHADSFKAFLNNFWNKVKLSKDDDYIRHKMTYGYAQVSSVEDSVMDFYLALLKELKSLGVNIKALRVEQGAQGLTISFPHPLSGKTLTFIFMNVKDLTDPNGYTDQLLSVINDGFDIYFQSAGVDLPLSYEKFLPYVGASVKNGGYFITDDYEELPFDEQVIRVSPDWILSDFFDSKPIPLPDEMGSWEHVQEIKDIRSGYGVVKHVAQKLANKAMSSKTHGGIDMNDAHLDMQINRENKGIVLPETFQNLENIHINGLVPVILEIKPAVFDQLFS